MVEDTDDIQNFIENSLGLVKTFGLDGFQTTMLKLAFSGHKSLPPRFLDNPGVFQEYFKGIKFIKPDRVYRPKGDSTIFTTAGVQHIETILRNGGKLKKETFIIIQPVIRSQFISAVREGVSTSFVDFSIESLKITPREFIELCKEFISFMVNLGIEESGLGFILETSKDQWGYKEFTKTSLTVFVKGVEVGEFVYIHDYLVEGLEGNMKISIADICLGVERFNWVIGKNSFYFSEFEDFYNKKLSLSVDTDTIADLIDCMRTATLIAGEGVEASHHDPGLRLRQLSKKYTLKNKRVNLDDLELIEISFGYWKKWGYQSKVSLKTIKEKIRLENERNFNVALIPKFEERLGRRIININVNQNTKGFLNEVFSHLSKDEKILLKELPID